MITAYPRCCLAGLFDRLQRYPQVLADKEPGLIFNPLKNMVDVMVMETRCQFFPCCRKGKAESLPLYPGPEKDTDTEGLPDNGDAYKHVRTGLFVPPRLNQCCKDLGIL